MSLASNKASTFNNIRAINSANAQGKVTKQLNSLPSINNKTEPIPYLLDVLKVVAGAEALTLLVGGLLTKVVSSAEPTLKNTLKKQFTQSNANDNIPTEFKTNGVNIPIKTIDTKKKYQTSPTSTDTGGSIIYGRPNNNNFDYKVKDSIRLSDQPVPVNNLSVTYNKNTDNLNFKPIIIGGGALTVGAFFATYIDKTHLINSEEIVANTMDRIFGTISKSQKKSSDQILNELVVEKQLEQVLNGNDSFVVSPEDYADLQQQAFDLSQGVVNYNMGCGLIPSSLSMSSLNTMINTISGSTDQNAVSKAIDKALDDSLANTPNVSDENKQTMKDGFFNKMINTLTIKMLSAVTTAPQVRALMGIMSTIQGQALTLLNDIKEDIKRWVILIKCMAAEIMKMIVEFIFALVVAYLIKLIKPIVTKIIKEKINQFISIVKNLIAAKAAKIASANSTG